MELFQLKSLILFNESELETSIKIIQIQNKINQKK